MRPLFSLLSPGGGRGRLSILIFHRVLPQADPLFPGEIDAPRFDAICRWLRQWFEVLPLDQALRRLHEGSLPPRAAAITFDDGYADNQEQALPILQRHGLNATFFIATGYLDGGCMWNDAIIDAVRHTARDRLDMGRLEGLPSAPQPAVLPLGDATSRRTAIEALIRAVKYLLPAERESIVVALRSQLRVAAAASPMMSSEQLRALRRSGMVIGAHTVSHPILARLTDDEARSEMQRGREHLQALLQERVGLFAYPNGKPVEDYSARTAALAAELGFDAAVTTAWGAARADTHRFQIPRFSPWDLTRTRYGLRMAGNLWRSRHGTPALRLVSA